MNTFIFKKTALSVAIGLASTVFITACSDGDNGSNGVNGTAGTAGLAGSNGNDGANGNDGSNGSNANTLIRLATVPLGAEVTGAFVTENGDLFFNVQHPDGANASVDQDGKLINRGTVGVVSGVNIHQLPKDLISTPVPASDEEQQKVMVAYGEYQVLGQGGDTFTGGLPQGLGTITATDGINTSAFAVDWPDFNGYVATSAHEGYLFTNWENVPGGMSRLKLTKDTSNGRWSVDNSDVMMLDFGQWGTLANCFGSVSPWGTPLTSEEWGNFGDNTHFWNDPNNTDGRRDQLARHIDPTASGAIDANPFPNTYRYHYIVEITDPTTATPIPQKRYAMGRFEHENSIVMPDQRTVYLSQDSTNGVFYKFVANTVGDLSTGTLYAAKLTQDAGSSEPLTTGFDIQWIELASSNDTQIETWIAQYDHLNTDDYVTGKSSYLTDADAIAWAAEDSHYPATNVAYQAAVNAGYTDANTFGGTITTGTAMDDRIAFLESRKAARAKGATAEWRKFEGIYINQKRAEEAVEGTNLIPNEVVTDAYVYFAISDMDNAMVDNEGDIQLSSRVKDCGGVYRMKLTANYDVNRIEPVIMGGTYRSSLTGTLRCDNTQLSQPDNVIVLDDGRILLGEDGFQTNNALWLYNPS